jgi:hypothetical protein
MKAVAPILLDYDHDKRMPLFGYGGSVKARAPSLVLQTPGRGASFPPYFNVREDGAESVGLSGLLSDYRANMGRICLGVSGLSSWSLDP